MRTERVSRIVIAFTVALFFGTTLLLPPARAQASATHIRITVIPHAGGGGPEKTETISGTAAGVDFRRHQVVVYAFAGGNWWVQPTSDSPLTDISENGRWTADTHLGTRYAALLVKPAYKPSAVITKLPEVGGDVLAVDHVAGRQ